MYTTSTVSRY